MSAPLNETERKRAAEWMSGSDTGRSSESIWFVMTGFPLASRSAWTPSDAGDFGRCYRLIANMPEWRPRLAEVGIIYPKWKPIVDAWDELSSLYEAIDATNEKTRKKVACQALYRRLTQLNHGVPDGLRKCEFCGCRTNARLRMCCTQGMSADIAATEGARP